MKTHGDRGWETFPSYLDILVPPALSFLKERNLTTTVFIVGKDAALEKNREALGQIASWGSRDWQPFVSPRTMAAPVL